MAVAQLAYLNLRIIVDGPRPTGSQRSTTHLIEPQPFFLWLVVKKRIIRKF